MLIAVLAKDAKELEDTHEWLTAIGVEPTMLETLVTAQVGTIEMVILKNILKDRVNPILLTKIPQQTGSLRVYSNATKK